MKKDWEPHLVPTSGVCAVFRPLVRNDLSFRETVVGFVAGLNFPQQGQRSGLSESWVNEQRVGLEERPTGECASEREIDGNRKREGGRESGAERRSKATSETELKHWCIL